MTKSKIIEGDAFEEMAELPPEAVHLIVTSPPYNVGIPYDVHRDSLDPAVYQEYLAGLACHSSVLLVQGGRLCVNLPGYAPGKRAWPHHIVFGGHCMSFGLTLLAEIIWEQNVGARNAWGSFGSPSAPRFPAHHEYIQIWAKGSLKREDRKGKGDCTNEEFSAWATSTWNIGGTHSPDHPAPFPYEIPKRLIKMLTWPGEVVLDPFCGRGTTVQAAVALGRVGIGIEISPTYAKVARESLGKPIP